MPYIKRTDGLEATIAGRSCLSVTSKYDESVTVAEVEVEKAGDIRLTQQEYETEKAAILAAPVPPPPPPPPPPFETLTAAEAAATTAPTGPLATLKAILSKADADITAGEVKTVVLIMARYFLKKFLGGWR